MARRSIDWPTIRHEYEQGASVKDLAAKHQVTARSIYGHASDEQWERADKSESEARRSGNFQPPGVLAQLLNISVPRLYQLANEGVIPKPDHKGLWELIPCVRGYVSHLQEIVRSRNTEGGKDGVSVQRERHIKAMADKEEINVETMRGDRVGKDEIKAHLLESFALMKQAVGSIPGRCAEQLSRETGAEVAKVREILFDEVCQIESSVASKFFQWAAQYRSGVGRDPGSAGGFVDSAEEKVA